MKNPGERRGTVIDMKMELNMLKQVHYEDLSKDVKILWQDAKYIENLLKNLKEDVGYTLRMIDFLESELTRVSGGIECPK